MEARNKLASLTAFVVAIALREMAWAKVSNKNTMGQRE